MNTRETVNSESGFSLIELMIVVAVVAILATVAIPAYFNHVKRGRQSQAIGELMAIKASQERYFAETGAYAGNLDPLDTYAVGASTYRVGYYMYWIVPNTSVNISAGTIRALGDLNGDNVYTDGWEVPIQDTLAKPKNYASGDEGFSLPFLGLLLD